MLHAFVQEKGKPFEINVTRSRMLQALRDPNCMLWVDLEDPNDFENDTLVEIFNFHPLAVEDCVSDKSAPKVDDYDEYLFLVMHAVCSGAGADNVELDTAELDMFLGHNYLVTYHKTPVRSVEQVREMIRKKNAFYMGHQPTLLMHSILDRLVDNYMPVLDRYDEKIDRLEDEAFQNAGEKYLATLLQIKHDLSTLRRVVAPQRDIIYFLTRSAADFVTAEQVVYFRDIYDHMFRIMGLTEAFNEKIALLMQVYFSYSSNNLNTIMKRMTALATLSMPSLIIASIYGMNFHHMPELDNPYGYFVSIGIMVITGVLMLVWMKWKKWI